SGLGNAQHDAHWIRAAERPETPSRGDCGARWENTVGVGCRRTACGFFVRGNARAAKEIARAATLGRLFDRLAGPRIRCSGRRGAPAPHPPPPPPHPPPTRPPP